jgi:hypothetical protein
LLTRCPPDDESLDEPGRAAARVLGLALGLLEPLAVDLRFGLRFADEALVDEDMPVAHATWHVRRDDLDDGRGLRPAFQRAGHQERRVAAIDAHSIDRIVGEALLQPAPPERRVTFVLLEAKNVRVRLLDPELAAMASIPVWRGRDEHAVPVVRDPRGSWIDSIPDALERPLWLTIDNIDGTLRVKLYVGWSLWKDQGSAEQRAILDFAKKMLAGGYTVDRADRELRAGLGA